MSELFYCPAIDSSRVVLQATEAHHAINVLRMKQHDSIRLFDGNGTIAEGRIAKLGRREVEVEVLSVVTNERGDQPTITIAAAVPKGDRLKWMVEKLTELGVDCFVPLQTKRSVVQPGTAKLSKLKATVISAAKQSGNFWMMELAPPMAFEALLQQDDSRYLLAHPSPSVNAVNAGIATLSGSTTILIGPEGGFTDAEVSYADQKNCGRVSWPGSILRIETAAVVFAAMAIQQRRAS